MAAGACPSAKRVAAQSDAILLTGENGTGKSLLAGYIHRHSPVCAGAPHQRQHGSPGRKALSRVKCSAHPGRFYRCPNRTDRPCGARHQAPCSWTEIANLPLAQQAKILAPAGGAHYEKLAARIPRQANIRFISATQRRSRQPVAKRGFRQDLLYRLNGVTLHIPALRQRQADIRPAGREFLHQARQHYQQLARARLFRSGAAGARELCLAGNIRELQHRGLSDRSCLPQQEEISDTDLQLARPAAPAQEGGANWPR